MTRAADESVGPDVDGPIGSFINDFTFTCGPQGDRMVGEAVITDELRVGPSQQVRPSALATLADVLAGTLSSEVSAPRLSLTLDIGVHVLADGTPARLSMAASVLKAGRNTVVAEVEFRDPAQGRLVAVSQLTFVPSPRPGDLVPPRLHPTATSGGLSQRWDRQVGVRVIAPGVAEIARSPYVVQLSGTLQGGIVALLSEVAAESLAGVPVRALQTRYLTAVRVGPGRATATSLGGGAMRVEVRDAGRDDRLAAIAIATTSDGPGTTPRS